MNNPCKECPYERDKYCDCIEFAKYKSYLNGAMEFVEWLLHQDKVLYDSVSKDFYTCNDDYIISTLSIDEVLAEWNKEVENE